MEIKKIRTKLKLTQVEFAAKVGVSPSSVAKWEAGLPVSKMAKTLINNKLEKHSTKRAN